MQVWDTVEYCNLRRVTAIDAVTSGHPAEPNDHLF